MADDESRELVWTEEVAPVDGDLRSMMKAIGGPPVGTGGGTWLDSWGLGETSIYGPASPERTPRRMTDPEIQETWLFGAVDLFALVAGARATMKLYDGDPDDERSREITSGPVFELFQRVNAHCNARKLAMADAQADVLDGESFWALTDDEGRPVRTVGDGPDARIDLPARIWPVMGSLVGERLTPKGGHVEEWIFPSTNGSQRFPPGAVVQFMHRPDKKRPWRGVSPLKAAYGPAWTNYLIDRYHRILLSKEGRKGGVRVIGGWMSRGQETQIRIDANEALGNVDTATGVPLMAGMARGKLEGVETHHSPSEFPYLALKNASREDIGSVTHTPSALLGTDTSNYATFQGKFRQYVEMRVTPYLEGRELTINQEFLSRLRKADWARMRVKFDLSQVKQIIADLFAQAQTIDKLRASGFPLHIAARLADVALPEELPGGDVGFLNQAQMPTDALILRGRAMALEASFKAAFSGWDVGVDPQETLDLLGVKLTANTEEAHEEEPPPEEEGPTEDDGAEEPEPESDGDKAARASVRRALKESRREANAARRRRHARGIHRRLGATIKRMRAEQLAALATFAEDGIPPQVKGRALYGSVVRWTDPASLEALIVAYEEDLRTEPTTLPERARDVVGCDGRAHRVLDPHRPAQERWLRRRPHLRRFGLRRLRDIAYLARTSFTEAEIDSLITLQQAKWAEEMLARILPSVEAAMVEAAGAVASDYGSVSVVDMTDPNVLAALRDKEIKVVEGTLSVTARRLRSTLIHTLATSTDRQSLHAAVKEALDLLKAGTTRAFNNLHARALAIARTEVGGAVEEARYRQLRQLWSDKVIVANEWLTSGRGEEPLGTVRHSHYALHGQRQPPGQQFVSPYNGATALRPMGFGIASEDINCECTLDGVLADEDD